MTAVIRADRLHPLQCAAEREVVDLPSDQLDHASIFSVQADDGNAPVE